MPDIVLRFRVDGGELKAIDAAGDQLKDFGRQADSGGLGLLNFNAAVQLANTALGALKTGLEVASQMNQLGREARSADLALSAFSDGKADQYLKAMDTATGGLVDRMTEAKDASFLLSHGIATSSEEIAKITHLGAVLGETMMNSATAGIDSVSTALEHVGNKRSLYQLSVDVPAVEARFKELKKTLGDEAAWTQAVEEGLGKAVAKVGDNFDKPGAGLDKLNAKLETLKETASKPISVVVDFLAGKVLDSNLMKILDQAAQKAEQSKDLTFNPYGPGGMATGNYIAPTAWGQMAGRISGGNVQGPTPGGAAVSDATTASLNSAGFSPTGAMTPEAIEQATMTGAKAAERHKQELVEINAESARYISTMQGVNANWREAVGLSAIVQANIAKAAADAKNATLIGGMVGGQGGQLSSDAQAGRAAREAADKAKGMSKKDIAADLTQFDATSKAAMDAYALATGTATRESLAFRDMQQNVSAQVASGKMSLYDAAKAYEAMAKAAADGKTNIADLNRVMGEIKLGQQGKGPGQDPIHRRTILMDEDAPGAPTGGKSGDAFQSVTSGAKDATTSVTTLKTSMAELGTSAATALMPVQNVAVATNAAATAANVGVAANGRLTTSYLLLAAAASAAAAAQALVH